MPKTSFTRFVVAFVLSSATLLSFGCNNNNMTSGATGPSGEVIGVPDSHCVAPDGTLMIQTIGVCDVSAPKLLPTNQSTCGISFDEDAGTGSSTPVDAATDADAGPPANPYGATMYGSAGDDDDCKYYISWISTPIKEHVDTYFTVTAIRLEDMKPATCAGIIPDVSLDPVDGGIATHGLPGTPPSPEIAPGVYRVGPLPFDKPGTWTVRFHLFEECGDDFDDSPHGHAAFYVNVP